MKGVGKVRKMICPYCGKEMFLHKREETAAPRLMSYFSNERSFKSRFINEFRCVDCVYIFGHGWLDQFKQYEFFVFRQGDERRKWNKRIIFEGEDIKDWKIRIESLKEEESASIT